MNIFKRSIAVLLIIALITPMGVALADTIPKAKPNEIQTVDNGYLKISVNPKNGGFHIATVEGDKLNKDDNNKDLLYPSGDYDTSFTTLRVIRGVETKDYIFGGKYSGSSLEVYEKDQTGITAQWSVDGFTVTQRLELVAEKISNHGMVQVTYDVENKGKPADVKLRILMDTALDKQDFAYYEVLRKGDTGFDLVTKEEARNSKDYGNAFFAYNNLSAPTITAYSVKVGSDLYKDHEKVIFGHWNNLASTAFDYEPDENMNFTNTQNTKYLTADSAYALYYDLGKVAENKKVGAGTIYGVYSHADIDPQEAKVTVDVSGPERLTLSEGKKEYTDGSFDISALLNNFDSSTLEHIAVAVRIPDGIKPVINGEEKRGYSHSNPYVIKYENLLPGQTRTAVINFKGEVRPESQYRKIILDVYDISTPEAKGDILITQNLIGTAEHYIYCPGGVMDLPKVSVLSGAPDMIYHEGTRYFYLTGTGFSALETLLDIGSYTTHLLRVDGLKAGSVDAGKIGSYEIDRKRVDINPTENTANLLLNGKLPVGEYQLLFKAGSTSEFKDITGPAMRFVVTDDASQKNTTYGLVAVTKTGDTPEYNIEVFKSETEFKKEYDKNPQEALLVFRGEFTTKIDEGSPNDDIIQVEGVSTSKDDNVMTLNNCIDIQEGTVVIRKDKGDSGWDDTIKVDFNAKLYTTGARSLIWNGTAGLTGLKDGENFGLIPYDKNGVRLVGDDSGYDGVYKVDDGTKPISIIWGSLGGKGLQALAGMLLKMEFGNLGVQIDTEDKNKEMRKVVSFGAKLDLGFLFPDPPKSGDDDEGGAGGGFDKYMAIMGDLTKKIPDLAVAPVDTLREMFESTVDPMDYGDDDDDDDDDGATFVIRVPDVLFGGAYLGFNFSADVKLPSYIEGFPVLQGTLRINTIGDWSMSAEGYVSFTSIVLEAKLGIKSYKGIPIPDNFYFYVGGFTPGINIDGFGVLWIMGGGGGLEGIYDTIFCTEGIPPLALLLSVQASIMQVFEARADVSLGLRGIGLELSDGKVMKVKVIDSLKLKLDWYPEFYFLASVHLEILEIIQGSGYIVVEQDGFFEFAARAKLSIPDDVEVFGGMTAGAVDLGANATRIYGIVEVLFTNFGVVYYWGKKNVEFGEKDDINAGPTYPDLLEIRERPVYVDPDTGETLYMVMGTNLSPAATQVIEGQEGIELMGEGHKIIAKTAALREHELKLDNYDGDHLLVMSYDASSEKDAEEKRKKITIKKAGDNSDLDLTYFNDVPDTANAHFNYIEKDKRATIVISFTDSEDYGKTYNIKTPVPTNLMLMKVAELPRLKEATYEDGKVTVEGNDLDKLESISFFAVNKDNKDDIYILGRLKDNEIKEKTETDKESLTYTIGKLPDTLPSGDYNIKVTGILEGYSADSIIIEGDDDAAAFTHINSEQPTNPVIGNIEPIGDGMVKVNLTNPPDCDGYIVNVYKDSEPTDIKGLTFGKDEDGKDEDIILFGGKYEVPKFETKTEKDEDGNETKTLVIGEDGNPIKTGTEKKGLSFNKDYKLGISAYKVVDERIYISGEVISDNFKFTEPKATTITATGTPKPEIIKIDHLGEKFDMPYYKEKDIKLELKAKGNDKIKGKWSLDKCEENDENKEKGYHGEIIESEIANSFTINLKDLDEGEHLLEFNGKNDNNDSVSFSYVFTVDTMPPRLLIESPDNGGFFDNSEILEIKGITDEDATITVTRGKDSIYTGKPILDGDGRFVIELNDLPKNYGSHNLTIIAEDVVGNKIKTDRTIVNKDLGKVTDWRLYAGDEDITDKNIMKKEGIGEAQLSLRGKTGGMSLQSTGSGSYLIIVDDPDIVSFDVFASKGEATIDSDNKLTVDADSVGLVSGAVRISDIHSIYAGAYFDKDRIKEEKPKPEPTPDPDKSSDRERQSDPSLADPSKPALPSFEEELPMPKGLPLPSYSVRDITAIKAAAGEKIYYNIPKDIDPNLVIVIYTTPEGEEILMPLSVVENGKLTFKAPYEGSYRIVESKATFDDIQGHWGNADILYVAARGLFNGTSEGIFSPSVKLTRAMMVTVLGRLANANIDGLSSSFADVPEGTWYTAYVTWAKENGIVAGVGDNSFEPDREITRQEFCTILYRYMNRIGLKMETEKLPFADRDNVAQWAAEAMEACVGAGLIVGYDNHVRPEDSAMRSESATIFARLIRLLTTLDME